MGSAETPIINFEVLPQNKVSDNNVMNQIHPNLDGPTKRKRECNLSNEKHSSKYKRIAHSDDENIYSDNNIETDTRSVTSKDDYVNRNNETKHVHSENKVKQPPIVVNLSYKHTILQIKSIINNLKVEVTYRCNGRFVAVAPTDSTGHNKIIEALRSEGAEFDTYARKSEIKPKIILKGLPVLPVEIIDNELQGHKIKITSIFTCLGQKTIRT
ncbi:hypothetical protein PV328_011989 [Microctonus aethiopoides]|uniref:Uncharacterized protein n=1 Tax=Microctonus aethiopoides TaxID=144406 RepID=A0AA39KPU6_9HYME|nr:hypothetical protein PV328_011989 [Microctonus aethiopoides]